MQFLDFFFGFFILFLLQLQSQLAGLVPEVIVAGVELDSSEVHITDIGADLIEEMAVMGYHDYGIFKTSQKILQPVDGFHIQMVGRLVQQQDIRVAKERLRQQYAYLLLRREVSHLHGVFLFGNAQTI